MGFPDINDDSGLVVLDNWVRTRSYIEGYSPSQADVVCFEAIKKTPSIERYPHACRWYNHIRTYVSEFPLLPGDPMKPYTAYGPAEFPAETLAAQASNENPQEKAAPANIKDDDDSNDLFGSDSEEEDPKVIAERERRLEEYKRKKAGKAKPAAKSIIILDIKPQGDDVDMNELKDSVLQITMDGLVWGDYKFVPVGYGIRKLQINLVVEDEKVSLDELEIKIVDDLPDHVQSMDVAGMQKL